MSRLTPVPRTTEKLSGTQLRLSVASPPNLDPSSKMTVEVSEELVSYEVMIKIHHRLGHSPAQAPLALDSLYDLESMLLLISPFPHFPISSFPISSLVL